MNTRFCTIFALVVSMLLSHAVAAEPTAEELLKPTRLTLITAGSDLKAVFADIEKQTGNKLVDETSRFGKGEPLDWNFSLSDREFWPLVDKFLDAAELDLHDQSSEGFSVVTREDGRMPRYGHAAYVGPFRLEVVQVSSRILTRFFGEHDATIDIEVAWEPRLKPLSFSQPLSGLQLVADQETPVAIDAYQPEVTATVAADSCAIELMLPLQLPDKQLSIISSLKGRIEALMATRTAEFRFNDLGKVKGAEQTDGGVKVVLVDVRENQGLTELHMRLEFDKELPDSVAQGSWNFQNPTHLENAEGQKLEHAGFETTTQSNHMLGLAYYFDVPEGKLADYTWVYQAPAAMVEVPIEFELKNVPLP
jgi:hypothetical protein